MSLINKLFNKKPEPKDVYLGLRRQVLTLKSEAIGGAQVNGITAFVMDMGMTNGVATIVATADGAVSMYTSSGGGTLGLGGHEKPRQAARELLQSLPLYTAHFPAAGEDYPLPPKDQTTFWLVSDQEVKTAKVDNRTLLEHPGHPLLPLFARAQNLITAIRTVERRPPPQSPPNV